MDSLIQNHNLKAKKRHVSATQRKTGAEKPVSNIYISSFKDAEGRDRSRGRQGSSQNRQSLSPPDVARKNHVAGYVEQSRKAKDQKVKQDRGSLSPSKRMKLQFNQVSSDSPFKHAKTEVRERTGNKFLDQLHAEPTREDPTESKYKNKSMFESLMLARDGRAESPLSKMYKLQNKKSRDGYAKALNATVDARYGNARTQQHTPALETQSPTYENDMMLNKARNTNS